MRRFICSGCVTLKPQQGAAESAVNVQNKSLNTDYYSMYRLSVVIAYMIELHSVMMYGYCNARCLLLLPCVVESYFNIIY